MLEHVVKLSPMVNLPSIVDVRQELNHNATMTTTSLSK